MFDTVSFRTLVILTLFSIFLSQKFTVINIPLSDIAIFSTPGDYSSSDVVILQFTEICNSPLTDVEICKSGKLLLFFHDVAIFLIHGDFLILQSCKFTKVLINLSDNKIFLIPGDYISFA